MRGSPVFKTIFKQICSYIIGKIFENSQKRPNLGTRPVLQVQRSTLNFIDMNFQNKICKIWTNTILSNSDVWILMLNRQYGQITLLQNVCDKCINMFFENEKCNKYTY